MPRRPALPAPVLSAPPLPPLLPPAAALLPWLRLGTAMTETWLAAAQVIALRLPLLGMAALSPHAARPDELRRMVQEKPEAFARAWQAAWWSAFAAPAGLQLAALAPLRSAARANARRLSGGRKTRR